jgi:cell division topological specificity factor
MFGFFKKKKSASVAKDRLTIAIMSDRDRINAYPFMDDMKAEIIEVVKKYIGVKGVEIKKEIDGDIEALSIDVELDGTSIKV